MLIRSLAIIATTIASVAPAARAAPTYAVAGSIAGPDGAWDYASVDPATRRLYVAHGTAITAVDLGSGRVTPVLAPANRPHAVVPIPGTGLLLETEGGSGTVRVLDAGTGSERAHVMVGENPDAAIWDTRRHSVIVMNAKSGTVMVVDPVAAKVTATIPLAAGLEFAALDRVGTLYVNNEDRNQMAVVDLDRVKLIGWIDLTDCEGPTGMAFAPTANRIVAACGNGVVAVVDPDTRRLVGSIPIGKGADAVIGDPARKRLFVPSGGSGTLAVLAERPGKIMLLETVQTEASARTGAGDAVDGKLYLPAARMLPPAMPGARRRPSAGSFHLIVVAPQ